MLSVLRIQNLAIAEELELEFGSGLNVLTGETGAGKSIILRAIDLLAGRRAAADIVRSGADRCTVEGLFVPATVTRERIARESDELDAIVTSGEEILIRRIVDRNGRSKIYLNGQLVTAGTLSAVSSWLLDITGQHHQQLLFDPDHHRSLLDRFGVPLELRQRVAESYSIYAAAKRDLDRFLTGKANRDRELSRISAELEELSSAAIRVGERDELEGELKRLGSVETLGALGARAIEIFDSDETGIDTQLRALLSAIDQAHALDPGLSELAALFDSGAVQLREARSELDRYLASLDVDPARLEAIRERIALIARLERKYARKGAELVEYAEEVRTLHEQLSGGGFDERSLRERHDTARSALDTVERQLTAARMSAAAILGKRVESELALLNMKKARFEVSVRPSQSSAEGADTVEMLLAANPGEPPKPLAKVASGGELSRLLLVLKTSLNAGTSDGESERAGADTQIFDEVDAGISGAVAQVVGERLFDVSRALQVIIITHSPQVAAFADRHFLVEKSSSDRSTTSSVRALDEDERVEHLAKMLAGKKVSEHFAHSARELLKARAHRIAAP